MKQRSFLYIILFTALSLFSFEGQAQQPNDLKLSGIQTGNINNKACKTLRLLPGYQFIAASDATMHAYIDPALICDVDYTTSNGGTDDGTERVLNNGLEVGTTAGGFDVSQSGGATYNIPIFVSPGTAGMQPNLSLTYNSQAGAGMLGMGWNLSGLSSITRTGQTIFHDGKTSGVELTTEDRFALDGNRLILLTGSYGAVGSTYATESETFSSITLKDEGFYLYFEVVNRDGTIMEYGSSNASNIIPHRKTETLTWLLNKVKDARDNYMEISYFQDNTVSDNSTGEFYPTSIRYTGNSAAGLWPYNEIKFSYGKRKDVQTAYVGGALITKSVLLSAITVLAESKVAHKYEFEYLNDLAYSKLVSIKESGTDGKSYNTTVMKWVNGNTLTINNGQADNGTISADDTYVGDYDGDGFQDLLTTPKISANYPLGSAISWKIYKKGAGSTDLTLANSGTIGESTTGTVGGSSSYNSFYYTYIGRNKDNINGGGLRSFDIDGDGKEDLIIKKSESKTSSFGGGSFIDYTYTYIPYLSTGTGFTESTVAIPPIIAYAQLIEPIVTHLVGDFDGDKKGDIFLCINSHFYIYSLETGVKLADNSFNAFQPAIYPGDYNGNGITDIMIVTSSGSQLWELKDGQLRQFGSSVIPDNRDYIYPGDYNGDGKTDMLTYTPGSQWFMIYSTGATSSGDAFLYGPPPFTWTEGPSNAYRDYNIADFNGDGRTDIMVIRNEPESNVIIYYSTGKEFTNIGFTTISQLRPNVGKTEIGDFSGDGKYELVFKEIFKRGLLLNFDGGPANTQLMAEISNGFNRKSTIYYKPTNKLNVNASASAAIFPVRNINAPIYVVDNFTELNTDGNSYQNKCTYETARIHLQGKGFLGFKKVTKENQTTKAKVETTTTLDYDNAAANALYIPANVVSKTYINNTLSAQSAIDYTTTKFANNRFFSVPSTVTETNFVVGTKKITNSVFDAIGNMTKQTIHDQTIASGTDVSTTEVNNTYNVSSCSTCPSLSVTSVVRPGQSAYVRHLFYETYEKRLPKKLYDENVQTEYTYDCGNPLTIKLTDVEGQVRLTTNEYDPYKRYVIGQTNPLNQKSTVEREPAYGNPITSTDINGLKTTNKYDGFGRIIESVGPTGHKTTTQRNWANNLGPATSLYAIHTEDEGSAPVDEYFDFYGRSLQTKTLAFDGRSISTEKTYNIKGQVVTSTEPHYATGGVINTTAYSYYDNDNRIKNMVLPTGATISYSYSGLTTTTTNDKTEKKDIKTYDATGLLVSATDDAGTVTYTYASCGKPITINSVGTTVTASYDGQGRQVKLTDPNAGVIEYNYTGYNEIKYQKDGKGSIINMEYDELGRIKKRFGDEGTTTYTYDTKPNGKGQLASVVGFSGITEDYNYDEYSRLSGLTETVETGQAFTTGYGYDIHNRTIQITYPSGYAVTQTYNTNTGDLEKVLRSSDQSLLWQCTEKNQRGQLLSFKTGNNYLQNNAYDDFGFLNNQQVYRITTDLGGTPREVSVKRYGYNFDVNTGNLLSRSDLSYGLTETFTYDKLDRLLDGSVNGTKNLTMSYAVNGNISSKSDAGSTYEYKGAKPNAVTGISAATAEFKNNATQAVTYTPYNKAALITESVTNGNLQTSYQYKLTYGSDHERRKSEFTTTGALGISTTITKYYSGAYEKIVSTGSTRQLDYLFGSNGLFAIHEVNNGIENLYYVYTDHLGSINLLTDVNGNKQDERSFDAWGRRRNPTNWTYTNVNALQITDRGYTGHEHLETVGLINMNGRMYDPLVGRMLSPDNFVQDATNTQTFNRYTYAHNNPLKYTDPDGNWAIIDDLIAGAIGGVVNWASNGFQFNAKGLGYFGAGYAAGNLALYGPAGWAAGGAILGASNAALGGGNSNQILQGAFIGGLSGLAGGAAGQWASSHIGNIVIGGFNVASPVLSGGIKGAIGGIAGGAAGGFTGGFLLSGGDLNAGWKGALSGAAIGGAIGGAAGAGGGYLSAKAQGRDPWTGKFTEKSVRGAYDIPDNWNAEPADGNGIVFKDPNNSHNSYRFMNGNPNSANPWQQNPYLQIKLNGQTIDAMGNPLPNSRYPGSHIDINKTFKIFIRK